MPDDPNNPAAAAAPVVPQIDPNEYAELRRKHDEQNREIAMLRENQLRMMAQPPQAFQPPAQFGGAATQEVEDEDIQFLDPQTRRAMEKLIQKQGTVLLKQSEETSRKTFLREAKKAEAINMFPDLKNPSSEFFKRVAFFMDTHPGKYDDPEGLNDACARIAYEMKYQGAPASRQTNENTRQQVAAGAASVEGAGNAPATADPEMDSKGMFLASKLGLDPKVMAKRLNDYQQGSGVYGAREGKTGKAAL